MNRARISRLLSLTALSVLGVVLSSSIIWAQTPPPADTLKVNYFSNAGQILPQAVDAPYGVAPDATVYVSNPGTSGGNICAMIYVLDPFQELRECCGCSLSPDALLTLSVNDSLTSNSNPPALLTTGTFKIVSSAGAPTCNPAKPKPTPAIRAWGTHIQNVSTVPGLFITTETDFQDATLSTAEVTKLASLCGSILTNSSGYGLCSCGSGDQ